MTHRPAHRRLPDPFLPLDVANGRAVRAFCYAAVIFAVQGLIVGGWIGFLIAGWWS